MRIRVENRTHKRQIKNMQKILNLPSDIFIATLRKAWLITLGCQQPTCCGARPSCLPSRRCSVCGAEQLGSTMSGGDAHRAHSSDGAERAAREAAGAAVGEAASALGRAGFPPSAAEAPARGSPPARPPLLLSAGAAAASSAPEPGAWCTRRLRPELAPLGPAAWVSTPRNAAAPAAPPS